MKEVNQFPSDIECMRYIATIADKVTIPFLLSGVIALKSSSSAFSAPKAMTSNPDFLFLQELLKKCHQCMETIVKAKDQQAAEANKNASILLKELDLEKVMPDCNPVLLMGEGCSNSKCTR